MVHFKNLRFHTKPSLREGGKKEKEKRGRA